MQRLMCWEQGEQEGRDEVERLALAIPHGA